MAPAATVAATAAVPPPAAPGPQGWVQPAQAQAPQGWGQPAPAPTGHVTILARIAGLLLTLLGVFWGLVGGLLIVGGTALRGFTDQFGGLGTTDANTVDAAGQVVTGIVIGFGVTMVVLAVIEIVGGLAIIFGKGLGRAIGIFYSLVFGLILLIGVSGAARASDVTNGDSGGATLFLLAMFLVYLYSFVVLLVRWRGGARA